MIRRIALTLIATVALLSSAVAQKTNIGYIYPAGAQRGVESIITIGGQNILTPKGVIISGEGVEVEVLPATPEETKKGRKRKGAISDEDNLQLAQSIRVKVTISSDAELGIRDLKVIGRTGQVSNILFFEIGDYPDFVESEPNNVLATANHIEKLPVTINGYVEKSTVRGDMELGGNEAEQAGKDLFSFDAHKGETIVAEVKARRFVPYLADAVPGWFQSVVSIYDENGREVAYCDDYMLRIDPVIIYNVERSSRYYIKIHDSIYRGREDFVYRINLGTIPFVSSIYPLGGEAKGKSKVELRGVNLGGKLVDGEESLSTTLKLSKSEKGIESFRYTNPKSKQISNEFLYNISGESEQIRTLVERGRGEGIADATMLSVGEAVNAKIDFVGDEDWYFFEVEKRQGSVILQVMGRKLNSPIDARLIVYDDKGKKLAESDDVVDPSQGLLTHHADPELLFKIPATGRYYVRITETQNQGGEKFAYQLRVMEYQPDFMLSIEPANLSIPQGGTSIITLFAQRKHNFKGIIDLSFESLPEGFEVSATRYAGQAKSMAVAITAPADVPTGRIDLKVIGSSKIKGGEAVQREAMPSQVMKQAFYINHIIKSSEFRVDVTPADPFTLTIEPIDSDSIRLKRDGSVPVRIVAHRKEGFNEEIQIMKKLGFMGILYSSTKIPEGESEVILDLHCPYWGIRSYGTNIMVVGTVKAKEAKKVVGQPRNTITASAIVNSRYTPVIFPTTKDPVTREEFNKIRKTFPK